MAKRKEKPKHETAGQPRKYGTPDEMQAAIDAYFKSEGLKTITGLVLCLGFECRQSFYDYEKLPEYSYIIKTARTRVESMYEERLANDKPTGAIFALKNMGWRDRQEHEHTGKDGGPLQVTVTVVNKPKD